MAIQNKKHIKIQYIRKANLIFGEFLQKEFLDANSVSQRQLARDIKVDYSRVNEIITGKRSVTIDTDLRLCKFFRKPNGYFIKKLIDLELKCASTELKTEISRIGEL